MATSEDSSFRQEHWVRWLETTCDYLFAEQDRPLAAAPTASRGARERFLYRARGKLLLLLKTRPPGELDALDELERTFTMQASFVARHPDVSRRLLGWLLEGSDSRISRRIDAVVGQQQARMCRIIDRARREGLVREEIEPQTAATLLVGMIQGLALRMTGDRSQREALLLAALEVFALFRIRVSAAAA